MPVSTGVVIRRMWDSRTLALSAYASCRGSRFRNALMPFYLVKLNRVSGLLSPLARIIDFGFQLRSPLEIMTHVGSALLIHQRNVLGGGAGVSLP